jgi:hypothetical protein
MANKDIDALAILAAQTPCAAERLIRSERFWDIKFQGLSIMPKRVKKPNTDDYMLGCVAEEDIEDGDHLVRGRGFWLDKACGPPTRANMGLEEKGRFDTSPDYFPWGINAEFVSAGEENGLRYCLSANCPMSLINDFRNISEAPNAALVLLSHCSVLLRRVLSPFHVDVSLKSQPWHHGMVGLAGPFRPQRNQQGRHDGGGCCNQSHQERRPDSRGLRPGLLAAGNGM